MERASQIIELNESQIENIFSEYLGNKGQLQSFSSFSLGAVNTSYKIIWDNIPYVLRLYIRDSKLAYVEKSVYQLVEKRISVPKLFYSGSYKKLFTFGIFEFIDKKHIFEISDISLTNILSYELGKVLATIHSFHFPRAGLFGKGFTIHTPFKEGSSPYFDFIMKIFSKSSLAWKRLGDKRAIDLKNFIIKYQKYFPTIHKGGVLIHSDFKPVNLLWNKQDGLTVLDWEFAHIGHPLLDLGILLRHFHEFPFNIKSFKEGYLKNRGILPDDWIRKARITDTINIIQLLNRPKERPQFFNFLLSSIDLTISNWLTIKELIKSKDR